MPVAMNVLGYLPTCYYIEETQEKQHCSGDDSEDEDWDSDYEGDLPREDEEEARNERPEHRCPGKRPFGLS